MAVEPHPQQARLNALADDLVRRGFGEGDEFFVYGHQERVNVSSEYVGLLPAGPDGLCVFTSDMGEERVKTETRDVDEALSVFVREVVHLVHLRRGLSRVDLVGLDVELPS